MTSHKPLILQGEIEATEIRISGKLPGRIDMFLVEEGTNVKKGDPLVIINSPEAVAKYEQVSAIEDVAKTQNKKIDKGTREQIIETFYQIWQKSKADLELAKTTMRRIETLYKDSVVTSQRYDEVCAIYKSCIAGEKAAYADYNLALSGAQEEDKQGALYLVDAAKGGVNEVSALLKDSLLTAPQGGQICNIYSKRGELVGAGMPIMNLIVLEDSHAVFNIREDLMPHFKINGTFRADVPAIDAKDVEFEIYYISPLGSFATWRSTKQSGSYDLRTFEIHAKPVKEQPGLRPGMSVLLNLKK